jgi:hypothetical protein
MPRRTTAAGAAAPHQPCDARPLGTWDAGPFGNDGALDYVNDVIEHLMKPVDGFMANPRISETSEGAFAAIALLLAVMERTPVRPWVGDQAVDGAPIRAALLECFDALTPDPDFKRNQRAALVKPLDAFVAKLAD